MKGYTARYLVANGDGKDGVYLSEDVLPLIEAATCVANAIEAGAAGFIKGTLMEKELRDALGLKPGELRDVPKK